MEKNFYNILGVNESASSDEIKKAYRGLSMKWHPDKNRDNPDAVSTFQTINEAYETLSDDQKRQEYNMLKNNPFMKMNGMNGGVDIPIDELFGALFGMHGPGNGNMNMNQGFPPGFPPGFSQGFSQGFPPNIHIFNAGDINRKMQKPSPIIKRISVTIEQILMGFMLPVEIERWIIENGSKIFEKETIYVDIPKGIDDNELILLPDKGNILNNACKGDIKLFVNIVNNTLFKRSGLDLIFEKSIALKDALCGFSFEIKYVNGKRYTINNNSGNIISHNYHKMIPNMGLTRDDRKGNLVIIFNVEFPEKLTTEQINKLKEIL